MRKTWLIARMTYWRQVRSGRFLILTFALPLIMIGAAAVSLIRSREADRRSIGWIDRTGRLAVFTEVSMSGQPTALRRYASIAEARMAFREGEVSGYLVVPEGYFQGERPVFYGQSEPGGELEHYLATFMRRAMLPEKPDWVLERLADPTQVTHVVAGGVEVSEGAALLVRFLFPVGLALLFAFAVLMGPGQMGSVIVREKDQRSVEFVITSLAPWELVAGKVLGVSLLSVTQIALWALGGGIALVLALSHGAQIRGPSIQWQALVWAVSLGVPGYLLGAVVASGLGIIAGDSRHAQQMTAGLTYLVFVPLMLLGRFVDKPDGPLAVGLTLLPLSGPMVGLLRMAFIEVPTWQLAGNLLLTVLSLAVSIWFVARLFRAAMLMYGQTLRPRQILRAFRQR